MNKFPEVKCQFNNECFRIGWFSFIDSHQRNIFLNRKLCLILKNNCFLTVLGYSRVPTENSERKIGHSYEEN